MSSAAPRRIVAGDYRWGYVQIGYARQWVRDRMVLYPPGTSVEQRRWMRAWRWLPAIVAAIVLGTAFVCGYVNSALVVAFAVAIAVSVGLVIVVAERTRSIRTASVSVEGWTGPDADLTSLSNIALIRRISARLRDADSDLRDGRIDEVEYEVIWASCHTDMAQILRLTTPDKPVFERPRFRKASTQTPERRHSSALRRQA
ncbi:hypothetical protein EF294_20360 [Gordonia oryzae]|uniref:Uncharacterized protein n=1 Tax=Gordonia oryzae TaxID=2487349 RepID=A0A3N4GD71_9ACTN|nr:DUF6611 family protein [Gordonia oryzae]RPA56931.1 hypothetical protein EF294_20360 [Gordonia oryzae]